MSWMGRKPKSKHLRVRVGDRVPGGQIIGVRGRKVVVAWGSGTWRRPQWDREVEIDSLAWVMRRVRGRWVWIKGGPRRYSMHPYQHRNYRRSARKRKEVSPPTR